MNADDHTLLEQTRRANKTLSVFVFTLQEETEISAKNHDDIADLLEALAGAIRQRGASKAQTSGTGPLVIEAETSPRALEPGNDNKESDNKQSDHNPDEQRP